MQRRWQVLTLVSVATFVASLDLFIVNIAFPDIRADLGGASVGALSWVLNAYAIVFAALLVPAGRLADRVGRKRGFLAGLALFSLGSALCGVAPSVATLVAPPGSAPPCSRRPSAGSPWASCRRPSGAGTTRARSARSPGPSPASRCSPRAAPGTPRRS